MKKKNDKKEGVSAIIEKELDTLFKLDFALKTTLGYDRKYVQSSIADTQRIIKNLHHLIEII